MQTIFIMVKCELGKAYAVADDACAIEQVSEVYSTSGQYDLLVKCYLDEASDIAATIVTTDDGLPITVGEVAEVKMGPAPKRGTAANQGLPAVVLTIQKSPGTNTLALTGSIDNALDQIEKALPKGMIINRQVFRQSNFIQRSVNNVVHVLRDATIIVAFILVLFLMNVRTTIITLTALPLSLATALLTMDWLGMTLNVMTLGGLAVAIGELVDDAIIDVENVLRRLKENDGLPEDERKGLVEVIYNASNEIRSSVVFATIIICMVFVPLLFLQGLEGRFFQPLGIAYIISIMASLIVALTVTPALCKWLFAGAFGKKGGRSGESSGHGEHDGWLVRWLKRRHEHHVERLRVAEHGALRVELGEIRGRAHGGFVAAHVHVRYIVPARIQGRHFYCFPARAAWHIARREQSPGHWRRGPDGPDRRRLERDAAHRAGRAR